MDRCAIAYEYHKAGYNCAQSVAGAFEDLTGLTKEQLKNPSKAPTANTFMNPVKSPSSELFFPSTSRCRFSGACSIPLPVRMQLV